MATQAAAKKQTVREVRGYRVREPGSVRTYTLVRLTADGGFTGWGECSEVTPQEFKAAARRVGAPAATAVEAVGLALRSFPRMGAAVNMALLDLSAQIAEVPVYQLLGGPTRNKARAMARTEGGSDEELQASMARGREAGYRAFAVPLPVMPTEIPRRDAFLQAVESRLKGLRSVGGADVDFVLEGAGAMEPGLAASVADLIQPLHPLWLDEPCPLENLETVRKVSEESVTPLGFGRGIDSGGPFQDLLREGLIDVLRPDLARHGITGIRRLAAMAETYYVAVAPWHDGGPVATAAALQVAASLPNFFIQQIPLPAEAEARKMRAELAGGVEAVVDGFAKLPTGPGLGVRIDQTIVERYAEELS